MPSGQHGWHDGVAGGWTSIGCQTCHRPVRLPTRMKRPKHFNQVVIRVSALFRVARAGKYSSGGIFKDDALFHQIVEELADTRGSKP